MAEEANRRFFVYTVRFPVFAAAGAVTLTFLIDNTAAFLAMQLTILEQAAAPALWGYQIQISDTRHSEVWFSIPVNVGAIAGTGPLPYPMSVARFLAPSTTITVVLEKMTAGAGGGPVDVNFHGAKVYRNE